MHPEEKLSELGLELPMAFPPNGTYVPYRLAGNMLYLSGHGPRLPNNTYRLGRLDSPEQALGAYEDARLTGLNMLASIKQAVGNLSRVEAIVKLLGMVHATPDFKNHSRVIDGCSDLLVSVFGQRGLHARSAVGMSSLPHGMTVEIEAIIQIAS